MPDLSRRSIIPLLGSAVAWPLVARAQQPVIPVVGFLYGGSSTDTYSAKLIAAFRRGLLEAGFSEGRNLAIEYRFAGDHYDRLPTLAGDLIQRRVNVIAADPRGVYAAQALTTTIPVVFMSGADPVRNRLVASLDRPGGNLTGVSIQASDLTAKRFGLFHDLVPQAAVIGVLSDSTNPRAEFAVQEVQAAARKIGVTIRVISAGTDAEIGDAFAILARERVGALFVNNGFLFFSLSERLSELAIHNRMALSGELRRFVEGGALMSYGPSVEQAWYQVGIYVGRILKGERPADLPVMLPTKFEFVINLKTARTLSIEIPAPITLLADEVLE
jgi:putative ABC transport system substrate-binding protein